MNHLSTSRKENQTDLMIVLWERFTLFVFFHITSDLLVKFWQL